MNQLPKKKVGGSAGLAAMIKQRTELVQQAQTSGQDPSLPAMIVASNTTATISNAILKKSQAISPPPPPPPPVNSLQSMSLESNPSLGSSSASPKNSFAAPPPPRSFPTAAAPPAPAAPTYLPKTTSFSSANKCYLCEKTVYKPEELVAVGHVWHDKCFTCGGKNKDGCGRTMKRDGYLDHGGEPYCQACYNKLFRTKGFGYGNSLNTNFGETGVNASSSLGSRSGDSAGHTNSFIKPETSSANKPTPPAAPAAAPAPNYTPTNNVTVNTSSAPKCTACAKTVFKMEETIAVGRVWHNACFVCGGTKGDGCGKTLKRDGYVDHDNQPYCNSCYSKLFKIKGFGYSNSLNTDYGPAPEASHAPTTNPVVVEGQGSKPENDFAKPKAPGRPAAPPPAAPSAPPAAAPVPPPPPPAASPAPSRLSETERRSLSGTGDKPPLIIPVTDPNDLKKSSNIKIGTKAGELYQEASYQGDNDEVEESEW